MTSLRRKTLTIHRRLLKMYGKPHRPRHRGDGLSELIGCILSQHTSDINSERAFDQLRARFPAWEQVRDAPVQQVVAAIRSAGLANTKAPRIQGVLRDITRERGELNLNFLARMPVSEAKQWLQRLHGVGPKTAAIVLLFALNRPAFPVDTHVHRVTGRLGLIPPKTNAARAHDLIEALVPPDQYYTFHVNLIRHGREICTARFPRCALCPLKDVCDYYQSLAAKR
jgi:endonuclease-3